MEHGTTVYLDWNVIEYPERMRTNDWYWALGIIGVCGAITAILFQSYLFALLIIIAAGTIMLVGKQEPRELECGITDKGIIVGATFYPFDIVRQFWVTEDPKKGAHLLLHTSRVYAQYVSISLAQVDPEATRELLRHFLAEEKIVEPLVYKLAEKIGI